MTPVDLHRLAILEARQARRYIARRRPASAAHFGLAFQNALDRISAFPTAHPPHRHGTRTCQLKRFSYYLVFLVEPKLVYILACAHDRRRPGYWVRRLPGRP